jgi:multisubunit Na+/H+ antiporter MnhG subunit
MRAVLTTTAVMEASTGLAMLVAPSVVGRILLGPPLEVPAARTVARVAGVALIALAVACWMARHDERSAATRGVVSAMVIYNVGALAVLVFWALTAGVSGIALWPAAIAHAVMAIWCISCLREHTPVVH